MENEEDEIEKKHHILLEKFLTKGDINSFRKMLNIQTIKKEKSQKLSLVNQIKSNNNSKIYRNNNHNYLNTENFSPLNIYSGFSKYENFNTDRKLPFQNLEKKNCLKGNYKSYSMKFNRIKMNWAKRKGISFENFQIPKIESFDKKKKIIDGNLFGTNIISDNFINEDFSIEKNNDIYNNYLNDYKISKSIKLPKVHHRNISNNINESNTYNLSNIHIN